MIFFSWHHPLWFGTWHTVRILFVDIEFIDSDYDQATGKLKCRLAQRMATRLSIKEPWLSVPVSQQVWFLHDIINHSVSSNL
jgi:hypothetical protein